MKYKLEKVMKFKNLLFIFTVAVLFNSGLYAQLIGRGDPKAERIGTHNGNQVRTVFSNFGVIAQPTNMSPRGAWKYDANGYIGDVSPVIGVRLPIKDYGTKSPNSTLFIKGVYDGIPDTIHSTIGCNVETRKNDTSPGGVYWGFEPIPGFINTTRSAKDYPGHGIAMSDDEDSWPTIWPDHPDWIDAAGKAEWNGYFGRGQMSADQESYFMMDDNTDEKMYETYGFMPDSNDATRKGQAIQVSVRGLQWANPLAENTLFWLYDVKNVGTTSYDQTVFGMIVGTYVGIADPEWNDDVSLFNIRESITYTWDFDFYISPSANPRWQPNPKAVGYVAYAFMESPGNQYDGIDNDGDNRKFLNSAAYFTEADFKPRIINKGDKLVTITKESNGNYTRKIVTFPTGVDTFKVESLGTKFTLIAGKTSLVEGNFDKSTGVLNKNAYDGIDNDLDGLIDENFLIHYEQYKTASGVVLLDTIAPVQYKNYLSGVGLNDKMIDEARNDGIDNNNNWSRDPETGATLYDNAGHLLDDVGADGKAGTHDQGEYDGQPTNGEPNFDSKDVEESDQIGLTNFYYYRPSGTIDMRNEELIWSWLTPGFFGVPSIFVNGVATRGEDGDFIYGSGYFPLEPSTSAIDRTERFSLALCFGDDFKMLMKTKKVSQMIYNANYNFPKPPDRPTVTAIAGNGQVTLYWNKVAENSIDPTLKVKDFEGYKIYKGTDTDFRDSWTMTDGMGTVKGYKPIAQFDLIDGVKGYFQQSSTLYDLNNALPFYLGDETGIQNSYVDKDVVNGRTYYYAVCAYDKGKTDADIFPSENTKSISVSTTGNITFVTNTCMAVPNAPVLGYVPPEKGSVLSRNQGVSTATPYFEVVDPTKTKNATYEVSFVDSVINNVNFAYAYNVVNKATSDTVVKKNINILPANGDIYDGWRLSFNKNYQTIDSVKINASTSGWNKVQKKQLTMVASLLNIPKKNLYGKRYPYDYAFVFSDSYKDSSDVLPSMGTSSPARTVTNFKVYNITDVKNPVRIKYAFKDGKDNSKLDTLSVLDDVYLSDATGSTIAWTISFTGSDSSYVPKSGDTLYVRFTKPFSAKDLFTFTTTQGSYDKNIAANKMKDIRVVPNPYIVTNVFEKPLPSTQRGRGERVINFINLPPKAKINIYASNGAHVKTLQHDGSLYNGTCSWDLRTKEGLDIAFGVYFYVVEVEGVSEKKTGKIAIIK
jgi:hypothetical protein